MSKLTAIIVDDMPSALKMLQNDIIKHHKEIEIIGTAKSVVEAAVLLRKKTTRYSIFRYHAW